MHDLSDVVWSLSCLAESQRSQERDLKLLLRPCLIGRKRYLTWMKASENRLVEAASAVTWVW